MAFRDDEFEFKPLSEGLGFHKKVIDLGDRQDGFKSDTSLPLQQNVPAFNPSLKNKNIVETNKPFVNPLARAPGQIAKNNIHSKLWAQPQQAAQGNVKSSPAMTQNAAQSKAKQTKFVSHALRDDLIPSATSWPAAIFDSTMVMGLVLVFSAAIFAITRIDLSQLIEMLRTEGAAQVSAVILLVSVYGMYTVTCRTFFGKTLGDSVFFYQLGTPQEQESIVYPAKVFLRSLFIAFTGFIVLPLLSTIFNKDVAGLLSGVSIYAEKK